MLMVIGGLGIYAEFQAPGLIFPGVAGGISLLLGLSSLAVMPINWVGAAVLILAVSLFVLEAKVASHGVLGTGGTVAMVLGSLLLISGPPELRIRLSTALAVSVPFALITMFLVSLAVQARRQKVVTGGALAGEIGQARTGPAPGGHGFLRGDKREALSRARPD